MLFGLEEIHREGCHERAREDERGNHGEDYRFSQRHKKVMGDASEKEHRQKNHADAQRRDQKWSTDLLRTHQDGALEDLTLLKVALDIFNRDGRVVDEDAHRQREAAERHDVNRLSRGPESDDRGEDRYRNRDRNDECATPAPEEEQYHRRGAHGREDDFADDAIDRSLHEDGLISECLDGELPGQGLDRTGENLANAGDDIDG